MSIIVLMQILPLLNKQTLERTILMPTVKFLQIHSLHGYSATLLNRDDTGLAKRILYGGEMRTRISSQCLKRHWRVADDVCALTNIDGIVDAVRSRETITRKVIERLIAEGHNKSTVSAIEEAFQTAVYGQEGTSVKRRQPLLLGNHEIVHLYMTAKAIVEACPEDPDAAKERAEAWKRSANANMKEMRDSCKLPGGLVSALFGRMVTSDTEANIDAAIHVAHAFTVHKEESESDYFTVVDDLRDIGDDAGADHIGETELTSGLFYGYVVLDREMLLSNLGGDDKMAGEVASRLVNLIATVSPGAKRGSTSPYSYASWMLLEAGTRQPRSLAEAFREPCEPRVDAATRCLSDHIKNLDKTYGVDESRALMSLTDASIANAKGMSLVDFSAWAKAAIQEGAL